MFFSSSAVFNQATADMPLRGAILFSIEKMLVVWGSIEKCSCVQFSGPACGLLIRSNHARTRMCACLDI